MELDLVPPVEVDVKRKIACMWCSHPIERDNYCIKRSIQTDLGVMKGSLHLGCSDAINDSPIELIKKGWEKSSQKSGCRLGQQLHIRYDATVNSTCSIKAQQ